MNNTHTVVVSTNPFISEGNFVFRENETILKGGFNFVLDLLNVDETLSKVKSITIDWGDGSKVETYQVNLVKDYYTESVIYEMLYNKDISVCVPYSHTYYPVASSYFVYNTLSAYITYLNGNIGEVYVPLKIAQNSYYDYMGEMYIINTQILPLSTSNTLLNVQGEKDRYIFPVITDNSLSATIYSSLTAITPLTGEGEEVAVDITYPIRNVTIITDFEGTNIVDAVMIRPNVPRSLYNNIGSLDYGAGFTFEVGLYQTDATRWGVYQIPQDSLEHTIKIISAEFGLSANYTVIENTAGVQFTTTTSSTSSVKDVKFTNPTSDGTVHLRFYYTFPPYNISTEDDVFGFEDEAALNYIASEQLYEP